MRNQEGCDIYIQPYGGERNPGYILIDLDHTGLAVVENHAEQWARSLARDLSPILYILYISNELISTTDEGLDIVPLVGIVVDRPADFSDRRVNAVFGLDLPFPQILSAFSWRDTMRSRRVSRAL